MPQAVSASAAKKAACRSRGITWVETGSGTRPSLAATSASTAGSMFAKVPTAPEIAQVATSSRAVSSRLPVALELGIEARELEAEGGGLGVHAVRAADAERVLVLEGAAARARRAAGRGRRAGGRRPGSAGRRTRCRAGRRRSCRGADSGPRRRSPPRHGSGTRSRRGAWSASISSIRTGSMIASIRRSAAARTAPGRRRRHPAEPGHRLERVELDLEPEPEPVLGRPDGRHLRARVASEHRPTSSRGRDRPF